MDIRLIEKYFAGKASKKEQDQVLDFFKKQNLDLHNEQVLKDWWLFYNSEQEHQQLSANILKKIHIQLNKNKKPPQKPFIHPYWLRIAAIVLIFISIVFILYRSDIIQNQNDTEPIVVQQKIKKAPSGTKVQFKLPDGSHVYLNSGSKLSYPESFNDDLRQVSLQGEAYFEIEKDSLRPFVVKCEDVETKVLGTSFNILAYNPDDIIVSLTSGSIKVSYNSDSRNSAILKPGEQYCYNEINQAASVRPFNVNKTIAWKDGILIFDDSDLNDIIEKLQRWYGVEIQVNGLADVKEVKWKYSGEFDNESLDNVLGGISYVKGFDFKIEGKKVYLDM